MLQQVLWGAQLQKVWQYYKQFRKLEIGLSDVVEKFLGSYTHSPLSVAITIMEATKRQTSMKLQNILPKQKHRFLLTNLNQYHNKIGQTKTCSFEDSYGVKQANILKLNNVQYLQYFCLMSAAICIGRILIASFVLMSAWSHLQHPDSYAKEYSEGWEHFRSHIGISALQTMNINWMWFTKLLGLLEIVCAIQIVFGEWIGGFLQMIQYLVSFILFVDARMEEGTKFDLNDKWNAVAARRMIVLGVFVALAATSCSKECLKSCSKNA